MARSWFWLLACVLLLRSGEVQAQKADIRGARDTVAADVTGPESGEIWQNSWNLISGRQGLAGTFHATVWGASAADNPYGEHRGVLRVEPRLQAGETPWQLLVAAWAFLGAALLLRGAHRPLAFWDGNDAS